MCQTSPYFILLQIPGRNSAFFLHFQGIVSVKIIKPVDTSNSVVISFLKTATSYVVCFDNDLLEETALIHRLLSSWALSYPCLLLAG